MEAACGTGGLLEAVAAQTASAACGGVVLRRRLEASISGNGLRQGLAAASGGSSRRRLSAR